MLADLNLKPGNRELRQFGLVAFPAFELLAAVVFRQQGLFGLDFDTAYVSIGVPLIGIGFLSLIFGLTWPKRNQPLYVLMTVATYPIGWVVSQGVMALLFFGVLTPIALLFRVAGRDPLERRWDRGRESYWVDLPDRFDDSDCFRQF